MPTLHDLDPPLEAIVISLSPRELEIFKMILAAADEGHRLTNREIAGELGIAVSTVKTFTRRLYSKFGVRDRTELIFTFYNGRTIQRRGLK
jgi:DNA-binding NarL/FixJ family response regulator